MIKYEIWLSDGAYITGLTPEDEASELHLMLSKPTGVYHFPDSVGTVSLRTDRVLAVATTRQKEREL